MTRPAVTVLELTPLYNMEPEQKEEKDTLETKKKVLVCLGERKREVTFLSEGTDNPTISDGKRLMSETCTVYGDLLTDDEKERLILQLKSEDWEGVFVDVTDGASIPDKSVLKAIVDKPRSEIQLKDQVSTVQSINRNCTKLKCVVVFEAYTYAAAHDIICVYLYCSLAVSHPRLSAPSRRFQSLVPHVLKP